MGSIIIVVLEVVQGIVLLAMRAYSRHDWKSDVRNVHGFM
jgi:uncharacterized membrane protein